MFAQNFYVISPFKFWLNDLLSASVLSGYRARLEIKGLQVQIRPRSMDFSGRKNPEHKSFMRDVKLGVPSLRFQARSSLKK